MNIDNYLFILGFIVIKHETVIYIVYLRCCDNIILVSAHILENNFLISKKEIDYIDNHLYNTDRRISVYGGNIDG